MANWELILLASCTNVVAILVAAVSGFIVGRKEGRRG